MASSNRHWPSLFKSKPCNSHHHWQHESYLLNGCNRNPYSSGSGCEERTPEPKPRWNPKPEQIRILESIFNSGMVNPPRDEIRKIRAQLQEFGQVGDANVFYWFQNRKSRSKHKLRHLHPPAKSSQNNTQVSVPVAQPPLDPVSSSSSSSEKSSLTSKVTSASISMDVSSTAIGSADQTKLLANPTEFLTEPFFFPSTEGVDVTPQGMGFSDGSLFLREMIQEENLEERNLMGKMMEPQMGYTIAPPITHTIGAADSVDTADTVSQGDHPPPALLGSATRSTVIINGAVFDLAPGHINVREAFGNDAVLVHSSGQPLLTDEWGFTIHSIQAGGLYYLLPLSFLDHHI